MFGSGFFGGPLLGGAPFFGFRPGLPPPGSGGGISGSTPNWLDDSLDTLAEGLTTALLDFLGVNPNNTRGVGNPPGSGGSGSENPPQMERGPNPLTVGALSLGAISFMLVLIELVTS